MKKNAFTLLELLVMIGIISTVAALVFPALVNAQTRARTISCLSQARQFAFATTLYTDDYEGILPSGTRDAGDALRLKNADVWHRQVFSYVADVRKIYECPAALGKPHPFLSGNLDYGANAHVVRPSNPLRVEMLDQPSRYLLIHDASRSVDNFQWNAADFDAARRGWNTNNSYSSALSRHSRGFIASFPDVHAERIVTYSQMHRLPLQNIGQLGDAVEGNPFWDSSRAKVFLRKQSDGTVQSDF